MFCRDAGQRRDSTNGPIVDAIVQQLAFVSSAAQSGGWQFAGDPRLAARAIDASSARLFLVLAWPTAGGQSQWAKAVHDDWHGDWGGDAVFCVEDMLQLDRQQWIHAVTGDRCLDAVLDPGAVCIHAVARSRNGMTPADVSVIIPTLNEEQRVGTAIDSAFACGATQVIVADGGSVDATVSVSRQAGARVCESAPGRGIQLRRGAEHAEGEILVFLHADSHLEPRCLGELVRIATQQPTENVFWGGFRQRIDAAGASFRLLEIGNAARVRLRGMPFGDQAMFVCKRGYDRVGGIPPLPLMEDVELAKALRRITWPVLIDCVVHIDARRWQKNGVVRQTLKNWSIQLAHCCGVTVERLEKWYR